MYNAPPSTFSVLKLKRKLAYKGHYMYDYVIPENVLNALRWLKPHNPLYANVEINEEWAQNAESNNTDLYAGLVLPWFCHMGQSDCSQLGK